MRDFLSLPRFFRSPKISKISIYSPLVKMSLKTGPNINFWTFLVFPVFESRYQHFGVATSAFLSRDIIILALLLALSRHFFCYVATYIFFYAVIIFFLCRDKFFFLLCRDIFFLCRDINNFESRHQHSGTFFLLCRDIKLLCRDIFSTQYQFFFSNLAGP